MAIVDEIERIKTNIANAYASLEEKGATLPAERNSANLSAVIVEVPTGGGDEELERSYLSAIDQSMGGNVTKLPRGIEGLRSRAFYGCSKLALTELPNTLTYIGSYTFQGAQVLFTKIPEGVNKLYSDTFYNCKVATIMDVLSTQLVSIAGNCFSNGTIKTVIIRSETVPTLANTSAFSGVKTIYVRDELIETYKSSTNWSMLKNRIKGISEYGG